MKKGPVRVLQITKVTFCREEVYTHVWQKMNTICIGEVHPQTTTMLEAWPGLHKEKIDAPASTLTYYESLKLIPTLD
jgi:hypothetical protein